MSAIESFPMPRRTPVVAAVRPSTGSGAGQLASGPSTASGAGRLVSGPGTGQLVSGPSTGSGTGGPAPALVPELVEGHPARTLRTVYRPAGPLDVHATLALLSRGGDGPCFRRTPGGVWLTMRTPQGGASLFVSTMRDGEVEATAWGAGAEWAISGVPELLGAGDDWSQLDVSSSPLLTEVLRRNPGVRLSRNRLVFEMLVPSVLEQKVTALEAWRAWRQLVRRHGDVAPGLAPEGMVVAPTVDTWRMVPSWEWHEAGVGPQRSETVVRSTRLATAIERTIDDTPSDASRRLQSLPGIGVWTAAEVTLRAHGDADAVSVGDYHLASTVGQALTGSPVNDDGMLELLAPWAGQRQRVLRLIGLSGIRKPRRGPKITIQDHRRH